MSITFKTETLPNNISRSACTKISGKLYIPSFGGNILEIYDPSTGLSETKTLPNNMTRPSCAAINGKLYMPEYSGTRLEIYDPSTGLSETKTLPNSMERRACAAINGKLYMPEYSGTKLEIYDPSTGLSETKTLPNSMSRITCFVINEKLYIPQSGGTKLEIYDPSTGLSETKTLPNSLDRATCTEISGKLYMPVYSGMKLEIYDTSTELTETKFLSNNMGHGTCSVINGKLYMPEYSGTKLEIYDPSTGLSETKTLPNSMTRLTCEEIDDIIYIPEFSGTKLEIVIEEKTTATFFGNGSNVGSVPSKISLFAGESFLVPSVGTMDRIGYSFIEWNSELDGSGISYTIGDTIVMTETDISFYAQWSINSYTVTFRGNGNDSGSVPSVITAVYLSPVTIPAPGNLARNKCRFTSWNDYSTGVGDDYPVYSLINMPAKNLTLYAQWAINETTVTKVSRGSQYSGDPAIIDGDLVKKGGDYQRVNALDNMIAILVGTDSGYWGNLIEPTASKIPGGMEKLDGEPITSSFLKRHAATVELCLAPMIAQGLAKSVSVESFNTDADRIDWTATIVLSDNSVYYYSSNK